MTGNTSASGGFLAPTSPPPIYDDGLADQFSATVAGITGLSIELVRAKWQPVPPQQPAVGTDWCAIGIMDIVADVNASIIHDGDANGGLGADESYRSEELSILVSFYGPNCQGYAANLRDGFGIAQNREAMQDLGVVFVRTDRLTAVPDFINNLWVRRVDVAFRVRRMTFRSYQVQNILSASGTVTVNSNTTTGAVNQTTESPFLATGF